MKDKKKHDRVRPGKAEISHKIRKMKMKKARRATILEKKSKRNTKPFPFLNLSAELRNSIYDLCLTVSGEVRITHDVTIAYKQYRHARWIRRDEAARKTPLTANILATCKIIHGEATAVLYGSDRFLLTTGWDGWDHGDATWTEKIGESVKFLRTVISGESHYQVCMGRTWRDLRFGPQLEKLVVREWFFKNCRSAKALAENLAPLMRELRRNRRGAGEENALDVLQIEGRGEEEVKELLREKLEGWRGFSG